MTKTRGVKREEREVGRGIRVFGDNGGKAHTWLAWMGDGFRVLP